MQSMFRITFCLLLLTSTALSTDNLDLLQNEMRHLYQGKTLVFSRPYSNKEQVYDSNGKLQGKGIRACPEASDSLFLVEKVTLTSSEFRLTGHRNLREVLFNSNPDYVRDKSSRPLSVRILSDSKPWDRARLLAAMELVLHPPLKTVFSIPQGASPPLPGSDSRIAFVLPDGPIYRKAAGITPPKALLTPDPEYTEPGRRAHANGKLVLGVVVGSDGGVVLVRPVGEPLGYGLDQAAMDAVKTWRFLPAYLGQQPVMMELDIEITFCLS
jgi:TonB family protein